MPAGPRLQAGWRRGANHERWPGMAHGIAAASAPSEPEDGRAEAKNHRSSGIFRNATKTKWSMP
jgi:hypothetical protein